MYSVYGLHTHTQDVISDLYCLIENYIRVADIGTSLFSHKNNVSVISYTVHIYINIHVEGSW